MIFVQIASYCDPELIPTLEDCLAKAECPNELTFGICNQDKDLLNDSRFKIINVCASESKGCCWARAQTQSLYDGEEFTLQIDSHHRFEPNWDTLCKTMLKKCPSDKPILTAYLGGYTPGGSIHNNPPWVMVPKHGFTKDGALLCVPKSPADRCTRTQPIPARFLSAHFLFTRGEFIAEVPYDPNLYFTGEEASLGVRAWTHGWDLFHPHQPIAWHEYTRKGRVRHWDEHKISKADSVSKARVRKLLDMEENDHDLTGYDLGCARTLKEYEEFAGVDFANRRFHADCMAGIDPPTACTDNWAIDRRVLVSWNSTDIVIPEDCTHVAYFIDDGEHKTLWHKNAFAKDHFQVEPIAEFCSSKEPVWLAVLPHTPKGPCKKFQMALNSRIVHTV